MGSTPGGDDNGDDRAGQPEEDLLDTSWLDEAFVTAAPISEKTAEERIAERREIDERRKERERREAGARAGLRAATTPRYRSLTYAVAAFLVLTMALAGVYWGTRARENASSGRLTTRSPATTRAPAASTTTVDPRPYVVTLEYPTYERKMADGTTRMLQTELWEPRGEGPFPLIGFAHGNDGNPKKFHELFDAWAKAGFAVVAPRFPVSADDANRDLADSIADVPEQDRDLEFVVAKALSDDAETSDPDRPRSFDPDRVAIAGLSLGGGTVLQAAYTDCCPKLKPKLVMAFSPVPYPTTQTASAAPLLLIHGTGDRSLPYQGSVDLFGKAPNRRWLLTLPDASHADPYEDSPSPYDKLVQEVTIGFLDQFVGGDPKGVERALLTIAANPPAIIQSGG